MQRSMIVLGCLALFGATAALPISAQEEKEGVALEGIFLPADRDLRQQLSRAETALEEARYGDAVTLLVDLLDNPDGEDYFLQQGNDGTATSLRAEAQRLLGSMPAEGRNAYEILYGARARRMLNEAVELGDAAKLTEVSRRFFHTQAGYEATLLLGRYHLNRGRPLAGALALRRIAETDAAARFEPELSLVLATCWMYAEQPEPAAQVLRKLKENQPNVRVKIAGNPVELFKQEDQALAWLEESIGERRRPRSAGQHEWVIFRGNASRTGESLGSLPLTNFRWAVPTVNDPADEDLVEQLRKQYLDQGLPAIPTLQPLAVDDVILMRTPDRLLAVDFASGKRIWEFPPWDEAAFFQDRQQSLLRNKPSVASPRLSQLHQRIWDDVPYGHFSSDGSSVFVIHDLGFTRPAGYNGRVNFIGRGGVQLNNPGFPKSHNQLASLDLESQGKLIWLVGGESGEDEPQLAGAFFLGAPLPLNGQLYVLAEVNGEIRLVVLDAANGRQLWSQQLAHVDARTILIDATRRLAGATPSFADGVLICPTSSGAVVAVDVATRSLLWGYTYAQQSIDPRRMQMFRMGLYPNQPQQFGNRWADASAAIADGKVIITPVESQELHCLDLVSGKPLWKAPRVFDQGGAKNTLLFTACVHNKQVVVVGKTHVTALNLADGSPAWKEPLALGSMPSGTGFRSGDSYFLPVSEGEVLRIDLASGTVSQRVRSDKPLGNLICYQGEVISQNVDVLSTFYQTDRLEERIDELLKNNPEDPWALARHGEILLRDGRVGEALAALERAASLNPDDDATGTLFVKTLLEAMRQDFAEHRARAEQLAGRIRQPEQRAEFHRLMAQGLQQAGELEAAFAAYLALIDGLPTEIESDGAMEQVERHYTIRRRRWVQAQLATLWNDASATHREAFSQALADRLAAAESISKLKVFVESFGSHPLASEARLGLAQRQAAAHPLEAELLLQELRLSNSESLAGRATARLAALLLELGRVREAGICYAELGSRFAEVECLEGKTGRELVAALPPESPAAQNGPVVWPSGRVEVEEGGAQVNFPTYHRVYPLDLREVHGDMLAGAGLAIDQQNFLMIRNRFGELLHRVPLMRSDGRRYFPTNFAMVHGKAYGHVLVLSVGYEILAIDTLSKLQDPQERILWRHDLMPAQSGVQATVQRVQPLPVENPWGIKRYVAADAYRRPVGSLGPFTAGGICFQQTRDLVCVDPLTGETVWRRGDTQPGLELFGDEEHLLAVAPGSNKASVYRMVDGAYLREVTVPADQFRWQTFGRLVLHWEQAGTELKLSVTDPLEGKPRWTRTFPFGSKGETIGETEVAVMQPGGELAVIELATGEDRFTAQLEPQKDLSALFVLRDSQRYVVVANGTPQAVTTKRRVQAAPIGYHSQLISGRVYCFDSSGRELWPGSALIRDYGLPLDQPAESPVIAFLRHETPTSGNVPRRTQTALLCLDKSDGRLLVDTAEIPAQTGMYELVATPATGAVELQLQGKSFKLNYTEEPRPPQPPAQKP